MSYHSKYLKYKMKYIELQKLYLIGGGKESAKKYFKDTLKKPGIFDRFTIYVESDSEFNPDPRLFEVNPTEENQDDLLDIEDELDEVLPPEENLDELFELFYTKLLELFNNDARKLNKYIDFIVKSYLNMTFTDRESMSSLEYTPSFLAYIDEYEILQKNRRYHPEGFILKELNKFKGFGGLENSLIQYLDDNREIVRTIIDLIPISDKEIKRRGTITEPFLETPNVIVYKPEIVEQCIVYGRNTRWCTAGSRDSTRHFNSYNNDGPLYIFISKVDPKIKFQLHVKSNTVNDHNNRSIELNDLLAAFNNDKKLLIMLNNLLNNYVGFTINNNTLTFIDSMLKELENYIPSLERELSKLTQEQIDQIDTIKIDLDTDKQLEVLLSRFTNLRTLIFDNFNQPLGNSLFGLSNLTHLSFGKNFNKPLDNSLFRLSNLTYLSFGEKFNQPIVESLSRLTNLKELKLSSRFTQPLTKVHNFTLVLG
jgi:hypothetical protein